MCVQFVGVHVWTMPMPSLNKNLFSAKPLTAIHTIWYSVIFTFAHNKCANSKLERNFIQTVDSLIIINSHVIMQTESTQRASNRFDKVDKLNELIRWKCRHKLSFKVIITIYMNAAFHHVHCWLMLVNNRNRVRGVGARAVQKAGTNGRFHYLLLVNRTIDVFDGIKCLSGNHLIVKSCVINHDKVVVSLNDGILTSLDVVKSKGKLDNSNLNQRDNTITQWHIHGWTVATRKWSPQNHQIIFHESNGLNQL